MQRKLILHLVFYVFTAGLYTKRHNSETHTAGATIAVAHYKRAEASPAQRNVYKLHDAFSYPFSVVVNTTSILR